MLEASLFDTNILCIRKRWITFNLMHTYFSKILLLQIFDAIFNVYDEDAQIYRIFMKLILLAMIGI